MSGGGQRSAGDRWYGSLLILYPKPFRVAYRTELLQVFRAQHDRARARGLPALVLFWLDMIRDVAWSALLVRFGRRGAGRRPLFTRPSPPSRQRWSIDVSTILHDVRRAVRALVKQPGFAAVVVLTLSLGIGATTALFSVIDGVLLAPLPYAAPDGLVRIWEHDTNEGRVHGNLSPADFFDYRDQNVTLAVMGAFRSASATLHRDDERLRIPIQLFTTEVFDVLGVPAMLGRTFKAGDEQYNNGDVVVLGYDMWTDRMGSDPEVVGKSVTLNGRDFEILGVMPASFRPFAGDALLWAPWKLPAEGFRPVHFVNAVARLKPGVPIVDARNDLMTIARRLEADYPDVNTGHLITIESLEDAMVGEVRPALFMMLAAVGFVFLIACANVANLFLSRSVARQHELAVRAALGAGRARLVRLLVTENIVLAIAGGVVGFGVAIAAVRAYRALDPGTLPRVGNVKIDLGLFLFACGLSVVGAVLFGVGPSVLASRQDPGSSLREGTRGTSGRAARRLRSGLIVVQMALAIVLLLGAGLLARSFDRLLRVDPGFDARNVVTGRVSLPDRRYADSEAIARFQEQLRAVLESAPTVLRSGTVTFLPLTDNGSTAWLNILGRPPWPGVPPEVNIINVSGDYFRAMGVRLLAGRLFDGRDRRDAPRATVINETMAREYWPGEDPIGQRIRLGPNPDAEPWEIVGVVSDMRQNGLDAEPFGASFSVSSQNAWSEFYVVLQMRPGVGNGPTVLREAVRSLDTDLAAFDIATMQELVGISVARPRFGMLLLGAFAIVALSIAAVGIYGLVAYSVAQRTQEIGIRMALGARARDVASLVVRQGLLHAVVAAAIGIGVGLTASRVLESVLYQVSTADPLTFTAVPLLLVAVAALASYVPAVRAARVDPVGALRAD